MNPLTPKEIVAELDKHIIGQNDAKRAVALALRTRWRRMQVEETMRNEISPKNILMIGPTGVGKTEIARRLAKLAQAPFIKVEATKFTEVGYVGRDVESIIRDLADLAVKMLREKAISDVDTAASLAAEERVLDALLRPSQHAINSTGQLTEDTTTERPSTRDLFRRKLRAGELDDKEVEVEINSPSFGVEIMAPPGMEEMTNQLQNMFSNLNTNKKNQKKLPIQEALKLLKEEEAVGMIKEDELKTEAIRSVEENGIVFIDEIDKVAKRQEHSGGDVSREGVQRDLLPLIEGCTISTKYGMIKTDHILFIASGAFHLSKPADLIPELQGRLPIRVELEALSTDDFKRILVEPDASLTEQYQALLKTEGLCIDFTACGIERIAQTAWRVNESTENIGARRLHTVLERVLESASFDAEALAKQFNHDTPMPIDAAYVDEQLKALEHDEDLSRYIL